MDRYRGRVCLRYIISLGSFSRDGRIWGSKRERIGKREAGMIKETKRAGEGGFASAREDAAGWRERRWSARDEREKPARREKSVGASTRRPMTSSELSASLSSHSPDRSVALCLFRFLSSPFSSVSLLCESDFFHYSRSLNSHIRKTGCSTASIYRYQGSILLYE